MNLSKEKSDCVINFMALMESVSGRNIFYSAMKFLLANLFILIALILLLVRLSVAAPSINLLSAIEGALLHSDMAFSIDESTQLNALDVESSRHSFDTQIIPLTSFGIRQGTGSQQLGLELRKELETGTSLTYGLVGNRVDDSTGYVVENPINTKAFVRVSQGLFRRWGSKYARNNLTVAELRQKEQEIVAERSRQSLILNTVQRYYDVVLAEQLLAKAENALLRSREHLEVAISRQLVGLVSKADVYRAEMAVLDAEGQRDGQLRQRERARDALRELLRWGDGEEVELDVAVEKMTPIVPLEWEETILSTRPDWQAQQVAMTISDLELFKAKSNLMPDVGLSFTVEQRGEGSTVEESIDLRETNWTMQLQMLSPLDSFNEKAALAKKRIERSKLVRNQEALRRKIFKEARSAFLDLQSEESNHQRNQRKLQEAERAVDLTKTRYEKGLSDNLEVLGAEAAFSEAEVNISRALIAYNQAAVGLAYSLGVLDRQWVAMALEENNQGNSPRP